MLCAVDVSNTVRLRFGSQPVGAGAASDYATGKRAGCLERRSSAGEE
jgi:hypothetical protein